MVSYLVCYLLNLGDEGEEKETSKLLVRGYSWAEYHADIYDQVEEKLRDIGLDAQCLGGGRIIHKPREKYIKVYEDAIVSLEKTIASPQTTEVMP